MSFFRKLIENAKKGYKNSEIEDKRAMGEEVKEIRQIGERKEVGEITQNVSEKPGEVTSQDISEGKKFCIGCLAEIEKTAKYCPECGRSQFA